MAGALASRRAWSADERAAELVRVLEMLKRAYDQLEPLPHCAASVHEQFMVIRSVQESALDDVQAAMALTRAGLVINTWCTATTMLVSTQATDGPLTIGGLVQLVGTVQPDPRHRAAVANKLAAVAYDNSAARQLGTCYFQAYEGFSLVELVIYPSDTESPGYGLIVSNGNPHGPLSRDPDRFQWKSSPSCFQGDRDVARKKHANGGRRRICL
jgi:hypothetical protein